MPKRYLLLTLCVILLQSCGNFPLIPPPVFVPDPITTLPPEISIPVSPTESASTDEVIEAVPTTIPLPKVKRVLIVSFDGLRPDAIIQGNMTTVLSLMPGGAYSLYAQTIMPSITLPAHSSMLVGTCPAKHIVRWNEYVPQNGFALGTDIFDLAHAAGLRTVFITGKEKLRQVTEPSSTDFFEFVDKTDKIKDKNTVLGLALEQLDQDFGLMFVHFAEGDLSGHESGWMSRQQLEVYAREDKGFGQMLNVLRANGMYDNTLIIVTSDHGGHDSTHGENIPEDMTIPWVISGPGIVTGELVTKIYTMDTAATAAFALGLPMPAEWDGIPVYEAFGLPVDPYREGGCEN